MFTSPASVYKGISLALLGYSAFAIADACVKWLSHSYSIYQILALENGGAAVFFVAFAPFLGGSRDVFERRNLKINVLRILLNFTVTLSLTYCYKIFPLANVYTMIFTKPFFAAMLAMWIYKEQGRKNRWIAIGTGFIGVVIAMRPWSADFQPMLLLPLAVASLIAVLFLSARSLKNP